MDRTSYMLRNKLQKLLTLALVDETLRSIYGQKIPEDINLEEIHQISRERASQMIQEFEEHIRTEAKSSIMSQYIESTDNKFLALHQQITSRTTFASGVKVNLFSAFLYSILLIVFLVIGNYTFPDLGESIADFFGGDRRTIETDNSGG